MFQPGKTGYDMDEAEFEQLQDVNNNMDEDGEQVGEVNKNMHHNSQN